MRTWPITPELSEIVKSWLCGTLNFLTLRAAAFGLAAALAGAFAAAFGLTVVDGLAAALGFAGAFAFAVTLGLAANFALAGVFGFAADLVFAGIVLTPCSIC